MTKKEFKELIDLNIDFEEKEEDNNSIVKRKRVDMKPMNEEEALLQMNLLGHDFFVFKDSTSDSISIIYKRKDGNYGILTVK